MPDILFHIIHHTKSYLETRRSIIIVIPGLWALLMFFLFKTFFVLYIGYEEIFETYGDV